MSPTLPALLCGHCGTCEVPRIGPGAGQHVARLECATCGRYIKWAPRGLVQPSSHGKEAPMVASINRVVLLGSIGPRGVEMSYHGQGTAKAAFMLVLTELGSDGKAHQLWQPVEIWGKTAERVGEYDAGSVVVVDGKLRRVKKGENWETVVSSWDCTPLQVPTAVTTTQS